MRYRYDHRHRHHRLGKKGHPIHSREERNHEYYSSNNGSDLCFGTGGVGGSRRRRVGTDCEALQNSRAEVGRAQCQQFLVSFPGSQLADNAQYWLAESYYVTDQFNDALAQFSIVINQYPDSRKVPDALLKMGYCNYELERWNDARAALTRVQTEYADTTAARLAEQRLNRMDEEGQ